MHMTRVAARISRTTYKRNLDFTVGEGPIFVCTRPMNFSTGNNRTALVYGRARSWGINFKRVIRAS